MEKGTETSTTTKEENEHDADSSITFIEKNISELMRQRDKADVAVFFRNRREEEEEADGEVDELIEKIDNASKALGRKLREIQTTFATLVEKRKKCDIYYDSNYVSDEGSEIEDEIDALIKKLGYLIRVAIVEV